MYRDADRWIDSSRDDNENFLTSLTDPIAAVDSQRFPNLDMMVEHQVRQALGISAHDRLRVVAPATPPRSGALVFVVEKNGQPFAVYKIANSDVELAREILSNRYIRRLNLPMARPAEFYRVEQVKMDGKLRPALVMEYVPRTDMEALLKRTAHILREQPGSGEAAQALSVLAKGVENAAIVLHELHAASMPEARTPVSAEFKNRDVAKVEKALGPETFEAYVKLGWLTPAESENLRKFVLEKSRSYLNVKSIPGSYVHGDAHPGNIVFDPATGEVRLIDTEMLFWSFKKQGRETSAIGEPMADVGRFVAAFKHQAAIAGLDPRETDKLTRKFFGTYIARCGFNVSDAKTAADFYFLRFAGVVLNAQGDTPNTPEMKKQMLELVKEKYAQEALRR